MVGYINFLLKSDILLTEVQVYAPLTKILPLKKMFHLIRLCRYKHGSCTFLWSTQSFFIASQNTIYCRRVKSRLEVVAQSYHPKGRGYPFPKCWNYQSLPHSNSLVNDQTNVQLQNTNYMNRGFKLDILNIPRDLQLAIKQLKCHNNFLFIFQSVVKSQCTLQSSWKIYTCHEAHDSTDSFPIILAQFSPPFPPLPPSQFLLPSQFLPPSHTPFHEPIRSPC